MRKLVLLLCCISVLSFAGCNTQKDVTEYNIADVETNLTKEEEHLKYLAKKSEESLSSIEGVESVDIKVHDNGEQGYSVQVSITTSGSLSDISLNQIKVYLENTFVNAVLLVDGVETPLGGVIGVDYNTETEYVYDDINNDSSEEYSGTEHAAVEYPALIRVSGQLYYDSVETIDKLSCGNMDGNLTEQVNGFPYKDNQCNFAGAKGYQYGADDEINVYYNDCWHVFKKFDFDEWNVLPEYVYDGDDILEKVITEYFISNNYHYEMKACVAIPAFCIFKSEIDENDDDICKVYGNFWMFVYEKDGTTLECISGAENPGVIYLKKNGDSYVVDHFDQPGEGAKYAEGIKRFSNGNKSLEDQYYGSTNAMKDPVLTKRAWYIKNYVEMFGLNIDSYHDSDWDKVLLSDFEFSGKEE